VKDGTLIKTKSGATFAKDKDDWMVWEEAVIGKVQGLERKGFKIVIISNQHGVGKGNVKLSDLKKKIEALQLLVTSELFN